jgi:hypothetical protein
MTMMRTGNAGMMRRLQESTCSMIWFHYSARQFPFCNQTPYAPVTHNTARVRARTPSAYRGSSFPLRRYRRDSGGDDHEGQQGQAVALQDETYHGGFL